MTPYRTAGRTGAREVVLCPACGLRVVTTGDDELRCECGTTFHVDRDDAELRSLIELTDADLSGHVELAGAAEAFGRDSPCSRLVFRCDGLTVQVGLVIDSGAARGVDYSIATRGLPHVTLRREEGVDVDAKETGVAREVQTGDEDFDRKVYIESDAADEDVLAVLRPAGIRAAIVSALESVPRVVIANGTVSASDDVSPECYSADRIRTVVTALRVIAGAPRRTTPGSVPVGSLARTFANLVYLLLPFGIAAIWYGNARFPPVSHGSLVLMGGLIALTVAALIQPLLTRALRGTSTSHRDLIPMRAVSFIGMTVLGVGLAIVLNGALDRSAPWTEDGLVESASYDDESGSTDVDVRTKARSAEFHVADGAKEVRRGNTARLWLRAGAFGQAWKTQPAVVNTGKTTKLEK